MPRFIDVDSFAGGGGASLGIQAALGKPVDIAINHDPQAIAMHAANHPKTRHYNRNVWQIDPAEIAAETPIRLAWFSPDCTHHSKAKGSAPIRSPAARSSRDLAWIVVLWAQRAQPQIIMLENVEEFADWAPLLENGKPCPDSRGLTFRRWIRELRRAGYTVEWRELRACDHGAPTVRKRLFVIARRDGKPIVWPAPTHGPGRAPYRTAADCIDWTIPTPSIFLSKDEARAIGCRRSLAEATMRRIARGTFKYVINAAEPFIVPVTHRDDDRIHALHEPLRTVTTAHRGEHAIVAPSFQPCHHDIGAQSGLATDRSDLVASFLAQHNTGMTGHDVRTPLSTIVQRGTTQGLVCAYLTRQFGASTGQGASCPAPTTTAGGGGKTELIAAFLSHNYTSNTAGGRGRPLHPFKTVTTGGHHALVQAFLMKYYGDGGQWASCDCPAPTLPCKHRLGIVTVGEIDYKLVDIGMRMLTPRELFRAQGFPDDYTIAPQFNGRPLTNTAQIRMCGNSVCPDAAQALVRANIPILATKRPLTASTATG